MTKPTADQIRQQFIDYFVERCGHAFVPSSSCVPLNDPTLMFTNAGMNQFKPIFLGTEQPKDLRVANSQKCIRAGGKHNDLDDVGHDTYHHTFFEMLGNWSFGDYFKKEAIAWAWDLLTNVWGLEKDRLHATYFQGDPADGLEADTEAAELWKTVTDIDPTHVHPGGKKDNFWEMGRTGPCGPCSEIHIDLTPDKSGAVLVNAGDPRVIEIWNLVFIQFNRASDGKLSPLPAKHVDTGMGFERITAILQGVNGNYDTDLFTPIFAAIREVTGAPTYEGQLESDIQPAVVSSRPVESDQSRDRQRAVEAGAGDGPARAPAARAAVMRDVAYRVVADHIRCLTFSITDGAVPDNEGRGYVLRRILRRAVRYGRQYLMGSAGAPPLPGVGDRSQAPSIADGRGSTMIGPFLHKLVPVVVQTMGGVFPELKQNPDRVAEIIREEEASFGKTLDRGIHLFEEAADFAVKRHHGRISGEDAFKLHDTYGFPIDLTELMAEERGLTVDIGEYERRMEQARQQAREAGKGDGPAVASLSPTLLESLSPTDDRLKYSDSISMMAAEVTALLEVDENGTARWIESDNVLYAGQSGGLVLNQTCFYAEQGGQIGDIGIISTDEDEDEAQDIFDVRDTVRLNNVVVHIGQVRRGAFAFGEPVFLKVNMRRELTKKNHTATHLLNWALREVLGDHVQQKGSLVDPDKTRFDLSHPSQITEEQLSRIEALVNEKIDADLPVYAKEVPQSDALKIKGLRAVFGEKYPDIVRVVSIGVPVDDLLKHPDNPEWMKSSVEFCGGTHLKHTGGAGRFRLIEESAVARGIRRVVGVTGQRAQQVEAAATALARQLKEAAGANDAALPQRITEIAAVMNQAQLPIVEKLRLRADLDRLQHRAREIQKQAARTGTADAVARVDELLGAAETVDGCALIAANMGEATIEQLRSASDALRSRAGSAAVFLAGASEGKAVLLAAMTKDISSRGIKAGDLIKTIAPLVGGRGGGRPDMAQGGGPDVQQIDAAVKQAAQWLRAKLKL